MKSARNAYKGGKRLELRASLKKLRMLMNAQKNGVEKFLF